VEKEKSLRKWPSIW